MKKRIAQIIPLAYGQLFNVMVLFSKRATAIKAFRVFCTIRKGKVLARQRQFLDEAKFKRISIAEHEIQAYRWKGTGDTVLLLHGWESNTFRWRNLIKKLQENNFDILAFDAPAHGYSNGKILHVPLYAEVTRHFLDTFKPTLAVAHSVGGMNIHYVHYLKPESSLKKIVTVGAPAEFLLFHDEDDLQVPVEASRKVHKHWKGSELVITKGLGHSMHQPEVNEKIIAFLKH